MPIRTSPPRPRRRNTTSYTYDDANELTTTTQADGTTINRTYDADGNLASQTDGAGHTTTYTYDPLDRLASTTDPLNRTTTYSYDGAGNRTSVTDARAAPRPTGMTRTIASPRSPTPTDKRRTSHTGTTTTANGHP